MIFEYHFTVMRLQESVEKDVLSLIYKLIWIYGHRYPLKLKFFVNKPQKQIQSFTFFSNFFFIYYLFSRIRPTFGGVSLVSLIKRLKKPQLVSNTNESSNAESCTLKVQAITTKQWVDRCYIANQQKRADWWVMTLQTLLTFYRYLLKLLDNSPSVCSSRFLISALKDTTPWSSILHLPEDRCVTMTTWSVGITLKCRLCLWLSQLWNNQADLLRLTGRHPHAEGQKKFTVVLMTG